MKERNLAPDPAIPLFMAFQVAPDSHLLERDFLRCLASLMTLSSHALASDVLRVAQRNAVLPVSVEGFQEYPDRGFGGLIKLPEEPRPRPVLIGTREFIKESGLEIPALLEVAARRFESVPGAAILLGGWDGWVR